jgi:hypothetical protein
MDKIYLCGGSLGAMYYIGIIRALHERNIRIKSIYGNSAGAFFALVYMLKMTVSQIETLLQTAVVQHIHTKVASQPWRISSYQMTEPCFRVFREIHRKYPNAYKKCSGKLFVGTVRQDTGFIWQSEFSSNEELFHAILCSSNIPFVCNYNAINNKMSCLDGCMGMCMEYLPADVVTIGVSNTDCMLNARLSLFHCFIPLPYELYDELKLRAYMDMCEYLDNPSQRIQSKYKCCDISGLFIWPCYIQKLYFTMYSYSDMCDFINTT